MNATLLNDCSHYHVGSRAVTKSLTHLAADAGIALVPAALDAEITPDQLVLLNGEGTLHHNAPRARQLLDAAARLKARGHRVVLLNATVQAMDGDFSVFDRVAVRESLSAEFVRRRYKGPLTVIPDAAFCAPFGALHGPRRGILFLDSVSPAHTRSLEAAAAEHGETVLKLCHWPSAVGDLLQLIASKELVVTGRFHGAVFALLTATPVIGYGSNTWKTRAMFADFGISESFARDEAALRAAIAARRGGLLPPGKPDEIQAAWKGFFDGLNPSFIERQGCPVAPNARCVLVGNGPSLIGRGLGQTIDAFEEIVRFNTYATAGFETDVGARTTLWSTFGHGVVPKSGAAPRRILFIHGNSGNPALPGEVWRIPVSFYGALRARIKARSKRVGDRLEGTRPSSGCLVAFWLLENGVRQLHLAGFDHFQKNQSKLHHYFNQRPFGQPVEHDGDAEAVLFGEAAVAGSLRYL